MKIKDIIIICGILLLAIASYFVIESTKEEGVSVIVKVNGNEIATYSLNVDGVYKLNGGTNTLCIKDGKAYLLDANCPDSLCVKQGAISKNGETITCLPNKLTVTVSGGNNSVELVS